jgi:hypothetical protein
MVGDDSGNGSGPADRSNSHDRVNDHGGSGRPAAAAMTWPTMTANNNGGSGYDTVNDDSGSGHDSVNDDGGSGHDSVNNDGGAE